jgi:hypothetical protein
MGTVVDPVFPVLRRLRQEGHEFKTRLPTLQNPVSKKDI